MQLQCPDPFDARGLATQQKGRFSYELGSAA